LILLTGLHLLGGIMFGESNWGIILDRNQCFVQMVARLVEILRHTFRASDILTRDDQCILIVLALDVPTWNFSRLEKRL
jgi:hypothetical protein